MKAGNLLPDPFRRPNAPTIGPSPVPVMEQVFWAEIDLSPNIPLTVSVPNGVTILDQTRPESGSPRTRVYMRASHSIRDARLTIDAGENGVVTLPLTVLSYRQDIEDKTREIEDLDSKTRKGERTYYTDDRVERARENLRSLRETSGTPKETLDQLNHLHLGNTPFDGLNDEALFQSLPSWNVPRDCYSNWPCPTCGDRIYKSSAYYPWKLNPTQPFKARCPNCKQLFPTNDYLSDDFTGGSNPDDGWGWNPGTDNRDEFAGWISHCSHMFWKGLGSHLHRLAVRYLLEKDLHAAHTLGVLLARMAYVYPGMNMRWQQVDSQFLRPGRLLLDGNWERNEVLVPVCLAYDAIFDYLDQDIALPTFLHTKDETISGPDDVKALVETYLIQLFGWDWMRRELSGGNMGSREEDMAQFAVLADMGDISDRWLEEVFTHAYNGGLDKGGFDDENLTNTVSREGVCWISALGYAYGYLAHKSDMAEILSHVKSPKWKDRCDLYNPEIYPKLRAEFDTWIDILVAGQFGPGYGDSGGPSGHRYPNGIPAEIRTAYYRAYRRWPTNKLARAIYKAVRGRPDLFEPIVWPEITAHVDRLGPEPILESRVMDGVGFALLESRPTETRLENRAGLALRYGIGRGHHHQDNLSVEFFAKGLSLTPDLGYPCWAHPMGDTTHVAHHITGMIDRSPQYQGSISRGNLETFYSGNGISFVDISARPNGFPNRFYRRATCLVDAPDNNVYVLDILRLAGGTKRSWCFHGPPHEAFDSNLDFQPARGSNFEIHGLGRNWSNNIVEPQTTTSGDQAFAVWKAKDNPVHLRVDLLGEPNRVYIRANCAKPDIPPIRYLFAEDEANEGASEFVSVWQPYDDQPFIENVERLSVEESGNPDYAAIHIRVTLKGGRQDTFFYSLDTDSHCRSGEMEFKGSFGCLSDLDGVPISRHLVNGTFLTRGEEGFSGMEAPYRTRITDVDFASNTISVDVPLLPESHKTNDLLYIENGCSRMAYHILEVENSGTIIKLDLDPLIYRSQILQFGSQHIVCETPPPIEAARGFEPGYYNGKTLTGEDGHARYRITVVDDCSVHLNRKVEPEDFTESADGRTMARIVDFGPGDAVIVYRSSSHIYQ